MDPTAAAEWIREHLRGVRAIQTVYERPWSTVSRVESAGGVHWFKVCKEGQAFEPHLTAALAERWPDLAPEVVAWDENRSWLLMADAGVRIGDIGNDPELWLTVLPRYAELQRDETAHAPDHLANGVPDLRVATLPAHYEELLSCDLALRPGDRWKLGMYAPAFEQLCEEVASCGVDDSIQHDDLHMNNVFAHEGSMRVLDWGDSSISHPFVSVVATFRFLEERNQLSPDDPWFARLRDAYLEPWGRDHGHLFPLAMRMGAFAHVIAALRQRSVLSARDRARFDEDLAVRLRRAMTEVAASSRGAMVRSHRQ